MIVIKNKKGENKMNNILEVFIKIAEDERLMKELSEKETIEDVYAYCTSISGGYTMDDFKNFLCHLFKDNYKIPEDNLKKIVGGNFSGKKLYLGLLSSMISFSPLINVKGLSPSGCEPQKELSSVIQKEDSLSEQNSKNKFSKLKKFVVGSSIVTAGALILGAFKYSIFANEDALGAHDLLKEFNDIHERLKWKLVIDGRYHRRGADIFESDHDGHRGEPGYRVNMIDALNYTLSNECMNKKFDDDLYLELHTRACKNVNFRNVNHKLLETYRFCNGSGDDGTVKFGLNTTNCSENGKKELNNKKNSLWLSDLLFASNNKGDDLAFEKLGAGGIWKCTYYAPTSESESDMRQAVNIIFEDYYLKLRELERNGYVDGSLIDKNACLKDKKLEIIIRICQNLDQLHAFRDANIRTIVFLVMQRMLIENGITPTVFDNPNCIDMMSVNEIMKKLKEGQKEYRKIVEESNRLKGDT